MLPAISNKQCAAFFFKERSASATPQKNESALCGNR
jgi:hypothetical protein